jgi:hypothetical protein
MNLRQKSRAFATAAWIGVAVVLTSVLGRPIVPFSLAFLGFAMIVIGGFGLIILAQREGLRPVPPGPTPNSGSVPTLVPPPLERSPVTSDFGRHLAPQVDRATTISFDLSQEFREYKRSVRPWVWFLLGFTIFLLSLAGLVLETAVVRRSYVGLPFGIALLGLCVFLFSVVSTLNRGATQVSIGPEGISFLHLPPKEVMLRWADPTFDVRVTLTSAAVNRTRDPPRDADTYTLFTWYSSLRELGPRIETDIPPDCFRLLLASAEAYGLRTTEVRQGVSGTISERLAYRLVHRPAHVTS